MVAQRRGQVTTAIICLFSEIALPLSLSCHHLSCATSEGNAAKIKEGECIGGASDTWGATQVLTDERG